MQEEQLMQKSTGQGVRLVYVYHLPQYARFMLMLIYVALLSFQGKELFSPVVCQKYNS
jgi:hypothetical protein